MSGFFYWLVVYLVVPGIMLSMLGVGCYVALRATGESRLSARAGLCAGLVLFAIYVVGSFANFQPKFGLDKLPRFDWIPCAVGCAVGFLVLYLVQHVRLNSGLLGLSVIVLVAASSTAVFSYFFDSRLRSLVIFLSLGALFGMLLQVVLFPASLRKILHPGGEFDDWVSTVPD